MSTIFRVGLIGCGKRGRSHARGYSNVEDAEIVACADPLSENLDKIAEEFSISNKYQDYREMLAQVKPDIVSVCTWPALHAQMILDSVEAGVKAIHSEKPMAPTWGESRKIHEACKQNNVMITFCHQRRFMAPYIKAKRLLNSGTIGELKHIGGCCPNLFDMGTHWFDLFFLFNNEEPAEWVMGQMDASETRKVFGVPIEKYGLSHIMWQNGVTGLLVTGGEIGRKLNVVLTGSKGIIEVVRHEDPPFRMLVEGQKWANPDVSDAVPPHEATTMSVVDLVDALKTDREPELSGRKAFQATELIFSTYESSRRRERIILPLDIGDSPLISMLESGQISA